MKIRIDKELLNYKLDNVSHAFASKSPLEVLTGIKLTVSEEGLELIASNGEISIRNFVKAEDVEIEEKGKTLVDGKLLVTICKALPNGTIELAERDNVLVVKGGKSEYKINLMDVDSYPLISFELLDDLNSLNIDSKDFFSIIKKVIGSVSTNEKKPILTGVNIIGKDGKITFSATDAFRLSQYVLERDTNEFNIVVPGASLNELLKCSFDESDSKIKFYGNKFIVEVGTLTFMTRLLDGQYPDVNRLIPSEFATTFEFNRAYLLSATNRISIMSSDGGTKDKEISHNAIKFTTLSNNTIKMISDSSAYGKASEEIELSNPTNLEQPVSFAFASKNLVNALNSFDGEFVKMNYTRNDRPFTITSDTEPNLIQLILPIRLS